VSNNVPESLFGIVHKIPFKLLDFNFNSSQRKFDILFLLWSCILQKSFLILQLIKYDLLFLNLIKNPH
jgi:hypothetical protein